MYTSFIKEIVTLFVTNSALAIMLLTGEYLMNTNLGRSLSQPDPQKKEVKRGWKGQGRGEGRGGGGGARREIEEIMGFCLLEST